MSWQNIPIILPQRKDGFNLMKQSRTAPFLEIEFILSNISSTKRIISESTLHLYTFIRLDCLTSVSLLVDQVQKQEKTFVSIGRAYIGSI